MRLSLITFLFFLFGSVFAQEKMHVSQIIISGNKITKESTILRELSFAKGDSITSKQLIEKIESSKKNIEKQWLFNFTEIDFEIVNKSFVVSIEVIERWYIWPYPILEISERNFNVFYDSLKQSHFQDFSKLNYGIFLNFYNFRGRNELLKLKFRKGYREHYLFDYNIPYLNKEKTIGVNLILEYFRMKKFHYQTRNNELSYFSEDNFKLQDFKKSISFQYKSGLFSSHKIMFENSKYTIPDKPILNQSYYIPSIDNEFILNKFQYIFENEKRNSISYPTEGNYEMAQLELLKAYENDFQNIVLTTKMEKHFNLSRRFLTGFSLKSKISLNDSLPYILNESLGYEDYLRGYEYYVMDGNHYGLAKTAFKYNLIPKKLLQVPYIKMEQFKKSYYSLYLSIFADLGVVYDKYTDSSNSLNNQLLFSQGVSLDFVTYYDKLMRFEISKNHLNEWGVFLHFSNPF